MQRSTSPVERIPVEILGRIFYFTSHIDSFGKLHGTPSRGISYAHSPLVLLRVCQKWRHVALATPKLFTQLYILDKGSIDIRIIIPLWLKHSKKLPLEVYICCRGKTSWSAKYTMAVHEALSQLREHLYRTTILGCLVQYLPLVFPYGTDTPLPQLNRLELLSVPNCAIPVVQIGHVFAPIISTVAVSSPIYFPYSSLHFGDKLTRFLCARQGALDPFTFFKLLAEHPNLEECQVIYSPGPSHKEWEALKRKYPFILLPQLRLISIEWECDFGNLPCILERLRTPSLEFLEIKCQYPGRLPPVIATWLCVSNPLNLHKLSLDFGRHSTIDLDIFSSLLLSIPNLKELIIQEGCWTKAAIQTLNKHHHEHICPSLIKLQFKSSQLPVYEVIKMVESRAIPSPIEKLQEFTVTYVEWRDEYGKCMEQEAALDVLCYKLEIHCPGLDVAVA